MAAKDNISDDPNIDLDELFKTNFLKVSHDDDGAREDEKKWNVFLIHSSTDFYSSVQRDIEQNSTQVGILSSEVVKNDHGLTYLRLATTPLKDPLDFNITFFKKKSWQRTKKPIDFNQYGSYTLLLVAVPMPQSQNEQLIKASYKIVHDDCLQMSCEKTIIYEEEGSNMARYIYGQSLDDNMLQIESINRIELLRKCFNFDLLQS